MSEIEKAKQTKKNCKGKFTRFRSYLEKLPNDESQLDTNIIEELKLRINAIQETWNEYERVHTELELAAPDQVREAERVEVEEFYYRYTAKAKGILNKGLTRETLSASPAIDEGSAAQIRIAQLSELNFRREGEIGMLREMLAQSPATATVAARTQFPLPKLDLPTFSGAYDEWLVFRDSFSAIIDKDELIPNIQKLRFLRSYLKGNAARVIESLETTENNYEIAWELLKKRYNNTRVITNNHVQAIFELPVVNKESSVNLRNLLDSVLRHVRALRVLEQPTDHWDTLLIYLINTKLDINTRREWERSIIGNKLPSFEELTNFLNDKCQMLETLYSRQSEKVVVNNKVENKLPFTANKHPQCKSFVNNVQFNVNCIICNEKHYIYQCPEFIKQTIVERLQIAKSKGLCFNCLRNNHLINDCKSGSCIKCRRRHHTLLHDDSRSQPTSESNKDVNNSKNSVKICHVSDSSKVLLSTAMVNMLDSRGNKCACRILLDSGSQPNLMTSDLARRLNLKLFNLNSLVEAVNSVEVSSSKWAVATLQSRVSSFSAKLSFLVIPKITGQIPSSPIDKTSLKIPNNVQLSDPKFNQPAGVEALIGAELFYELLGSSRIPLALPRTAVWDTKLGGIVTGKISSVWKPQQSYSCHLTSNDLDEKLERFWKIDNYEEVRHFSNQEQECETHYITHTQRDRMGKYVLRLPFKENVKELGESYDMARRRFFALERRLTKNVDLKEKYCQFMREYEELGHMELVKGKSSEGYYMPHQAVVRESSMTTKLRVVFDASSKTSTGVSLNDTLLVGPTIQDSLFSLILRFRQHPIAISADVEKMYRQFWIHPEDRKYQKILWRANTDEPLKTYQLTTVTYGTSAAPFLAIRTLQQLAIDEGTSFPIAARTLKEDFYVDDMLTGENSLERAECLKQELNELVGKGGLRLLKWSSNCQELIKDNQDKANHAWIKLDPNHATKTLGVSWNAKEDMLLFGAHSTETQEFLTKKTMLSQIAQLYDPLGIVAPIITFAKIKLQQLWKLKINWDDPVPQEMVSEWKKYQEQLSLLNCWKIPRTILEVDTEELQLHGFADASEKAYGACVYLRVTKEKKHSALLLCAKSRVAPIKTVSLPRLELCAALTLAKLYKMVKESLKLHFVRELFWSDSTIALNWISSSPHELKTFVANRVAEIQNLTSQSEWRHVASEDNPADFVSRGQLPKEFINNEMWKHGPKWLVKAEDQWPAHFVETTEVPERKGTAILTIVSNEKRTDLWTRFSSWTKLIRTVAYCLRLVQKSRKQRSASGSLSSGELSNAKFRVLGLMQQEEFPEEIRKLTKGENLPARSRLIKLNPIIIDNLLKVGGRIKHANMEPQQKHPILLPKDHPLTNLIIRDIHGKYLHAGVNGTLYAIRREYWPIDGRLAVRKVLHECVTCFRVKPNEVNYRMANLPKVRLTPARPFENTGVDFCGPFFVKEKTHRNRNKVKVYAAVFICLSIKAVHIELVGGLTTELFIASLRRFFARRGRSRAIYSDNGTNFVGANNVLGELYGLFNSKNQTEKIENYLSNEGIEWHFAPPRTPHFGGVWEAAVKSLKHHLRRTIGETLFTFEELSTYMCEIEAVLNSRPLTPMSSDPNDLQALTPGHFLINDSLMTIPTLDYSKMPINRLSTWQHMQKLKTDLWNRWHCEYLSELNVRNKWHTGSSDVIKIGTLVVLRDENLPPMRWKLGRVLETHPGDDGIIRVVTVKTENGIVKRGVKKVSPLPIVD